MATVPASTRSTTISLLSSGAGPFDIGFRLFDTDTLDVFVDGVRSTAWTVSATFVDGFDDDATITFTSSITAPATIVIDGSLTPRRTEDFITGPRGLVRALNIELARVWSALSELKRDTKRAVKGFAALDPDQDVTSTAVASAQTYAAEAEAAQAAAEAAQAAAQAAENTLIEWRGVWQTATAYAPSDLIRDSNNDTYVCLVAHTSGTFATDLSAARWQLFVPKGSAGAGTGDLLASNALSELAAAAGTARNNLSAMGAGLTAQASTDVRTIAQNNPRGFFFVAGTSLTNAPPGYAANDTFITKGVDANNVSILWFRQDGEMFIATRVAGTWGAWKQHATTAYVDTLVGQVLHVRDEKTSGTAGGTSATSYTARVLNTVKTNTISGASLASSQITLPAGTYLVDASAPALSAELHKAKLYNVTDGADAIIGTAEQTFRGGNYAQTRSRIQGVITIAGTKVFEVRHRASNVFASVGFGQPSSFGDVEVYTEVLIRKLA